jgi:uncharacterized membrane protein YraQ (UPF0718 family)
MIPNKSLIIIGLLAAGVSAYAFSQGTEVGIRGLKASGNMFVSIVPNLAFGFLLAGMAQVLIPREQVSRFVGEGTGWLGILFGTGLGAITPGGPFAQFPLIAALFQMGAAPGPLAAYITSFSLFGLNRIIVYEWPLLGAKFTTIRVLCSLLMPLLIGELVALVYRKLV